MSDPQIATPQFNPVSLCCVIIHNHLMEYHCGMTEKGLGVSGFPLPLTGRGKPDIPALGFLWLTYSYSEEGANS